MSNFQHYGKAVRVERDAGYKISDYLSTQNRKKARERINNPNRVSSKEFLKELFGEMGIVVYPDRMSYWYQYGE